MGRKIAAIALSLGCLHTGSVMALGLGELKLESFLNEPLKAQVDLLNVGGLHADEIKVRLATREDFEKLGLERAYFLTGIKFEVVVDADGGPRIIVSSDDPVLEPYLDFIVEARWPSGRLLREYTVLVDPPVFDETARVISASERVEEVEGIPAPGKKTDEPAVGEASGTQVKMRKSTLGPGEMPERDFSAGTSPAPVAGQRYMIHRDDTLWEIAQQARPGGASVHQTMLDIQRLNPDAFIDGNINRIKAGYIIYLPSESDISSADLAAALAEVRQQNEDWRAGRASAPVASSGPTLRISADEQEASVEPTAAGAGTMERDAATGGVAAGEQADLAALESADTGARLAAMEQQVETLNRIVSLKDEQIAALQAALAEAQSVSVVEQEPVTGDATAGDTPGEPGDEGEMVETAVDEAAGEAEGTVAGSGAEVDVTVPEVQEQAEPVAVAPGVEPSSAQPEPSADKGGMMSYLLYGLGAALIAILGFVFLRRRGQEEQPAAETATPPPARDVFADVKLKEQPLQVEPPAEEPEPVAAEAPEETAPVAETRGYGERKHDEYASDMNAGDALAEADIYIAYGRYPQAIDLLGNAVANEPGNAAYRLKLLELYAETDNADAAREQLDGLRSLGDTDAVERGEAVLADMARADEPDDEARRFIQPEEAVEVHDDAPPGKLAAAPEAPLESDFSGLEIEEPGSLDEAPEELDLSADFSDTQLAPEEDEDLVIAADSNGLSTKLDLARAYLDMGDEDGARQILEEVIAEGGDELKAEASALLERIG
jgi:pilus assembly protein FimV